MSLVGAEDAPARAGPAVTVASVRDLRVHFRSKAGVVHAVDGVSFDIGDRETVGLVGETGCGKSVTARSFLGLVPMPPGIAAGGSIEFRPREACPECAGAGCLTCDHSGRKTMDLLQISEREMRDIRGDRIAMIFQDPAKALNPALPVGDQVAEVFFQHRTAELLADAGLDEDGGALIKRRAGMRTRRLEDLLLSMPPLRARRDRLLRATSDRVAEALAETQIPNPRKIMERYPHELSGGMQQRVMIAQALACDPDLLIADEPTTALDVTVQARILELIRELQQRHHASVLYISHDLALVRKVCDRVAVMYAGRIVENAPTDTIFEDPSHPYTRGLLAAIPSADHERGRLVAIPGNVPELIDPPEACRFAKRCPYAAPACHRIDPQPASLADGREVACLIHHWPTGTTELPSFARSGE